MNTSLFTEFDSVSAKAWKQKIQVGLKGADFNDSLVWQSLEGIHVKPFYHGDDFEETSKPIPGKPNHWHVVQRVHIDKPNIANKLALDALRRGADALLLSASKPFPISEVFQDFPFDDAQLYFKWSFMDVTFFKELLNYLKEKQANFHFSLDILHHLTKDGNWFHSLNQDHTDISELISHSPDSSLLGINLSLYQNAGANMVQQLAYALAHANEYLNHFQETFSKNPPSLCFQLSVGSNYFFEIAKIRALRWLVASIAEAYGFPINCHILALPSKRNKTLYDYNVNMLRTTMESMAAALGGANAICNLAYDAIYHKSNEFGERISRNQLLLMKSESYMEWVSNPVDGSYYIEHLTSELAEKSLAVFKEIEQGGGFLSALKEGTIQRKLKESAEKEQQWFDEGKLVLVGTNKYPNPADRMSDDLELYPFLKHNPRKTILQPIVEKRLAEKLEKARLHDEKK